MILLCAALPLMQPSAAVEIAYDLLRCNDIQWHGVVPLREHINFLMLLAHSRANMLGHSSHAIAAAAILTSLRLQAGLVAAAAAAAQLPAAAGADGAVACAAEMWAMLEGAAPPPPAAWSDVVKSAPTAMESKAGPGRASPGAEESECAPTTGQIALVIFARPCPRRWSESRTEPVG
jgi:hypothetical protein